MKANELMIGDWVDFGSFMRQVIQPDYYQDVNGDCVLDGTQPIPLTAEILEKNGFERRKLDGGAEVFVLADDYYDITIYEWSDSIWVFRYECTEMNTPYEQRTFSYVHNLQHALRECGIDKDIVL